MTKESPAKFNAEMVRAILDGRKTQTRRPCKVQPSRNDNAVIWTTVSSTEKKRRGKQRWRSSILHDGVPEWSDEQVFSSPFGKAGDNLWVQESWSGLHEFCDIKPNARPDTLVFNHGEGVYEVHSRHSLWYWADGNPGCGDWEPPRRSIHMPRWASRITLEVKRVWVERIQDITNQAAKAEGVESGEDYRGPFRELWEQIYGLSSWSSNVWVWCCEFAVAV